MDDKIADVLKELEERSAMEKSRRIDVPADERMLAITKETGELLNMILSMTKAKNGLEIGMSTGYSTIWCADVIRENSGKILTIEKDSHKIRRAKENFERAGVSDTISIRQGLALEVLRDLSMQKEFLGFFDFVLIDADKENVMRYFDLVFPLVKVDGVIVTDNMHYPEKYRKDMKAFSEHVRNNSKVKTITSPIGNGEEITIKLKN